MDILLTTILKRPYVLAFLLSYLVIAGRLMGWRWTILFLFCGYTIAFLSEYLSINYGVPYGWYLYKYENLEGEWLNHGVPVWDSLSYVFMNFAGLAMGKTKFAPKWVAHGCYNSEHTRIWRVAGASERQSEECSTRGTGPVLAKGTIIWTWILSALLVTLLDVVVDPVAHRGAQWFLGDIYYYPNPGFYFDVTLANFAGWYVTCLAICGVGILIDRATSQHAPTTEILSIGDHRFWTIAAIGLYYGIMTFGIAVAIYLREWWILLCDLGWVAVTVLMVFSASRQHTGKSRH